MWQRPWVRGRQKKRTAFFLLSSFPLSPGAYCFPPWVTFLCPFLPPPWVHPVKCLHAVSFTAAHFFFLSPCLSSSGYFKGTPSRIGLDALFILIFEWGLLGAGLATVLCEYAGGLFPLIYFLKRNTSSLQLVKPEWDGPALWKICTNGSSELLTNISMSFVSMLYNYQLITIAGTDGVAAFGVIMYVAFFFEAIFIGYSMGTAPIVSYNYGARRDDELQSIFRKSLTVIAGAGLFLTTSAYLAAPMLANIFVGYDETLATLTVRGFRFFSFSFLLNGFCMYGSAFFTALNNGFISSVISLLQSVVFQIIAVIVLPLWLGTDGIWLSVSIAKLLAFFVTVSFWIACRKEYHYA